MVENTQYGLPSNATYEVLYIDVNNELWIATLNGVAKRVGRRWELIYNEGPIHDMLFDSAGRRWFGRISNGIRWLDGEIWDTQYADTSGLQNIRRMTEDDQGGIWFATSGGGVARYYNDEWRVFNEQNESLPSNMTEDIEVDKFGRIWVATQNGLAYTSDYGETWMLHNSLNIWHIEFGCQECPFDENDMWLVLHDNGIAHADIPPIRPIISIESPPRVQIRPGDDYVFEIEVHVLDEKLVHGDALFAIVDNEDLLYGAYGVIEIPPSEEILPPFSFIFTNERNPIRVEEPGSYRIPWRVWQSNRYVSEIIYVEFDVIE